MYYRSIIAFLLILFACKSPEAEKKENKQKTVFRYNEMAGITSLDPARASTFENIWACSQLFNGLVKMDENMKVTPDIAKRWKLNGNGKEYEFHLRDDVFFHTNEASGIKERRVTADDFVYSFSRLFDGSVSSAASLLRHVDSDKVGTTKGFKAESDTIFKVYLKSPFAPFLGMLTMEYFSVIPQEAVKHYKDEFARNPVGTGPFNFKSWAAGSKLILLKNENYFEVEGEERLPYLDAVSISFIKDRETAFLEFMKGNLEMLSGADAINMNEVFTINGELNEVYRDKFKATLSPFLKTDYLGILVDEGFAQVNYSPLKLKAVRRAINFAIDREKLIKYLRHGAGVPANCGITPVGLPGYLEDASYCYSYDPEKAKKLLEFAGYKKSGSMPQITLHSTVQNKEVCEYVQAQLSEVGITVNLSIEQAAVLYEAVARNQILFFKKSWVGDYPDAENFLSLFYSKNFSPDGFNYFHYNNPNFDRLYERAIVEKDEEVRIKLYKLMSKIVLDDAPIIPLYYDQVVRLQQNYVKGLKANAMNSLDLTRVKVNK